MLLLHNPQIIFLDEPTLGLDVLAKKKMINFLKKLNREKGTTIVVTSHDMDDLEEMAERIILLSKGQIAFDGNFEELRKVQDVYKRQAMASAITDKPDERQSLITFRAMGAYIGEFIIGFFGPIIIYERVIKNGATHVLIRNNGDIFPIAAGAISLVAILCYYICYQCTTCLLYTSKRP